MRLLGPGLPGVWAGHDDPSLFAQCLAGLRPAGATPQALANDLTSLPGLHRTSVFDRLGAETKADTTTGNKVSGKWGSPWGLSKLGLP